MYIRVPGVPGILRYHLQPSAEKRSYDLISEEVKGSGSRLRQPLQFPLQVNPSKNFLRFSFKVSEISRSFTQLAPLIRDAFLTIGVPVGKEYNECLLALSFSPERPFIAHLVEQKYDR